MAKDNKILGEFTLHDILPGPAGLEMFELLYDIDADGILTVTATHKRTEKAGITLNASTAGRLTNDEINVLGVKAEEIKIHDQAEENRVLAFNKLLSLCSKIRRQYLTYLKMKIMS